MKFIKDNNCLPLDQMVYKKIRILFNGKAPEIIWTKVDDKNKKLYLQNHAFAFAPYPSWGLVLELKTPILHSLDSIEIGYLREKEPDKTVFTIHYQAYNILSQKKFLDHRGRLTDLYFEKQGKYFTEIETLESQNTKVDGERASDSPLNLIL